MRVEAERKKKENVMPLVVSYSASTSASRMQLNAKDFDVNDLISIAICQITESPQGTLAKKTI